MTGPRTGKEGTPMKPSQYVEVLMRFCQPCERKSVAVCAHDTRVDGARFAHSAG